MNVRLNQQRGQRRTASVGSSSELPRGRWLDHVTRAFAFRTGLRDGEQGNFAFGDLRLHGAAAKIIVRVESSGEPATRKSERGR
jgi:hypothetical protein